MYDPISTPIGCSFLCSLVRICLYKRLGRSVGVPLPIYCCVGLFLQPAYSWVIICPSYLHEKAEMHNTAESGKNEGAAEFLLCNAALFS